MKRAWPWSHPRYLAKRGLMRRLNERRSPAIYELTALGIEAARHVEELADSALTDRDRQARQSYRAADVRNHSETRLGCIVSLTTSTRSPLMASRSTSSRRRAENASSVCVALYLLR
jgi:hypothetical protein